MHKQSFKTLDFVILEILSNANIPTFIEQSLQNFNFLLDAVPSQRMNSQYTVKPAQIILPELCELLDTTGLIDHLDSRVVLSQPFDESRIRVDGHASRSIEVPRHILDSVSAAALHLKY